MYLQDFGGILIEFSKLLNAKRVRYAVTIDANFSTNEVMSPCTAVPIQRLEIEVREDESCPSITFVRKLSAAVLWRNRAHLSYLTEELVRQGHEVTLFASGDSQTKAILRAPCERALRLNPKCKDPLPYHLVSLNRVARSADAFDIIHFHTDLLHLPLFALG